MINGVFTFYRVAARDVHFVTYSKSEMSTQAKQTSDKSLQNWKTRRRQKPSPGIGLQFHWNLVFNVNTLHSAIRAAVNVS